MAVTYTNHWKNVADKLQNLFRVEFGASLPIYIGEGEYTNSQFIKILPSSNSIVEKYNKAEMRTFSFIFSYNSIEPNVKEGGLTNVLRVLSRIESLIGNNQTLTLADSSVVLNGILESYNFADPGEIYKYIVEMDYICNHIGDLS